MANNCASLALFLSIAPEFVNVGPQSTGVLTVTSQPSPGDTVSITQLYGSPLATQVLVADTDFDIGVDEAATAANIVTAIGLGVLATATSVGAVVNLLSVGTGGRGTLSTVSSVPAVLTWTNAQTQDGTDLVEFYLDCTCSQINLECWGVKADCGHVFLTGHFLAVAGYGSGEKGTPASKTFDKLAISYAVLTPTTIYGSTKWGRQYEALKKTLFVAPIAGRCTLPFVC